MISYQTAYLKANFPVEFMAALLSIRMGSQEKVSQYINECRRMEIKVLPPDINDSFSDFKVVGNSIRFGLSAIKNVGLNVIEAIEDERKLKGFFKDFYDFCLRIDNNVLNKKTLESLMKGGAFDSLGHTRKFLMENFEKIVEKAQKIKKDRMAGQFSLFGDLAESEDAEGITEFGDILETNDEYDAIDMLNFEKEMLGLYISSHPLSEYDDALSELPQICSLAEKSDNSVQTIGGIITKIKTIYTKKNQLMHFITFEDKSGSLELVVFPRIAEEYKDLILEDKILKITGKLDKKEFREEIEGKEEPEIDAENGFEDIEKEEEFNSGSINELQKESKKNYALKIIVQKIENLVKNGSNNIINNKSHEQDVAENGFISYTGEEDENTGEENIFKENQQIKTDRKEIILKMYKDFLTNSFIDELYDLICMHKGNTRISIHVMKINSDKHAELEKKFVLPKDFNVEFSKDFISEIEKKFTNKIIIE